MSLRISLTPDQVVERLGAIGLPVSFTQQEHEAFSITPVVDLDVPCFSFPIPIQNSELTLRNIKGCSDSSGLRPLNIFDHPWYGSEPFMATACEAGLHVLTMDVLPDSIGQPFNYVRRLETLGLRPPSAVEVVLLLFLHYIGTKEQLLMKKHTWCADTATLGRQVTVGAFGRNGVFLSGHPSAYASRGLGFCGKVSIR